MRLRGMPTSTRVLFLDGAGVSWKVKLSSTVCLSTQEAEYNAQTEGTKEALNLLAVAHLDPRFGVTSW